jgi:hypothetical protein
VSPRSSQPGVPQMTGFTRTELAHSGKGGEQPAKPRRRQWSARSAAGVLVVTGLVRTAVGQESGGGGVRVETSSRSYTLEALVVAAFLGLALFSVCRSSRRV